MPAPRVAPLRTGSGAEAMNDESLASFGVPLANARGQPPGSRDGIFQERGRSSHVQYATGATAPAWFCQYRVIGVLSGLLPWPRRASSPFAVMPTQPGRAGGSHVWGEAATSLCMRYGGLLISVVPQSLKVFDWASVKLAAPAVWAVKSGDALTVPPMPDSSFREWVLPCMFGIWGTIGAASQRRMKSSELAVSPMMLIQNPSASGAARAELYRLRPLPYVVEMPHHTGRFALAAFACARTVLKNPANSAGVTWLAWSCTSNASAPAQAAPRVVRTYHSSRLSPVSFGRAVSGFPRSRPGVMMHLKAWACASAMKLPM